MKSQSYEGKGIVAAVCVTMAQNGSEKALNGFGRPGSLLEEWSFSFLIK